MANGSIFVNNGLNLAIRRLYASDKTVVSQFQCGTGTTTPAVTDTGLETATGGKYNFVAGYPVFDTTNKQVTVRGFVPSTDLNGSTITEVGEFNTDGTPIMIDHDVFTGITKTTSVEVAFIWKHSVNTN